MVEKAKKQKKGSINEEDVSTILKRYPVTTVLTLLQEVAQVADFKIDWNELVKKTNTGISSAREYQMLWRHLAYRNALLERLDEGDQPLDDDSDLEYELEAFPTVSSDASTEAAAFVKVLIASALLSNPSLPNGSTIEAPLTINIPNGKSTGDSSENSRLTNFVQGTNITIPVSVKKQPGSSESARRKRKTWTPEEDDILKTAVEKCGEGNWATILKGYFKDGTKASQLSQRWAIIRKRPGNMNVAGGGSQPSEGQLAAAHRAMSLALDRPRPDNSKASNLIGSSAGPQSQHRLQPDSSATVARRPQIPGSRVTTVKPPAKSVVSPNKLVKAAAVAAGARIATTLDTESLLKAAQAKNAIHIMPVGGRGGGGPLIKSSVATAGNPNPLPSPHPNVHYICTGLGTTISAPPRSTRPSLRQSPEANHFAIPTPNPIPHNEGDATICSSGNEQVEENRTFSAEVQDGFSGKDGPKEQVVKEDKASVLGNKLEEELVEKDKDVASHIRDVLDK